MSNSYIEKGRIFSSKIADELGLKCNRLSKKSTGRQPELSEKTEQKLEDVEVHRTESFPSGRTGLIEAGYRPDRTLSSLVSDGRLFSELGNEHYEKRSRLLPQSGEKLFPSP